MTPEALRSLIANAETLDVEFKGEEVRALSDGDLVEAVVCLANRPGNAAGWLLVGLEDDGRVTGVRPRHADRTDPLRLQSLIAHRARPSLSARVEIVRLGDRDVIAVEVPAARSPVGTTDGRCLRRALGGDGKPACLPLHFHEMRGLQADRGLLDYSRSRSPKHAALRPQEPGARRLELGGPAGPQVREGAGRGRSQAAGTDSAWLSPCAGACGCHSPTGAGCAVLSIPSRRQSSTTLRPRAGSTAAKSRPSMTSGPSKPSACSPGWSRAADGTLKRDPTARGGSRKKPGKGRKGR